MNKIRRTKQEKDRIFGEPSYRLGHAIAIIEVLMGKSLIEGISQNPQELRIWKQEALRFLKQERRIRVKILKEVKA